MPTDLLWKGEPPAGPWLPGWTFWAAYEYGLSQHYERHVRARRRPIQVMLPDRNSEHACSFIIDSCPTGRPEEHWDVRVDLATCIDGEKPNITLSPSIRCYGIYHGFLVEGTLSDDLGD